MVILCSMMLHCASRVGFLSYLYQQREQIAYSLGLIAEVPIAMCSGDYNSNVNLVITVSHDYSAAQPTLPVALEIKLFFVAAEVPVISVKEIVDNNGNTLRRSRPLHGCLPSIFHPPAHRA